MRFTIKREEFLKGVSTASRAVTPKAGALPILTNLKIELNENGMFIVGSNYDFTIRSFVPYRRNEIIRNYKEGSILLNSKIINDCIRKMDSDEVTVELVDSSLVQITNNCSDYRLDCARAEEYPDLDLEPDGVEISLSKHDFSLLVSQTAFAASIKEQRPVLTAVNLEAGEGKLIATATDSARMAQKTILIPSDINFVANIPAKMMVEVDRLTDNVENVNISVNDKKALFAFDNTLVATRLIAGEYPNTKSIIPHITNYSLEVNSSDLMKAIDRANTLSLDRENVVQLSMNEDELTASSKSSQIGSSTEKIAKFNFEGNNLQISFNSEFVLAAIRALDCEDVTFLFVGEMKPFVVKNALDDSVLQIVTPVRTF